MLPPDFSVEERESRAMDYFKQGFNCCQSIVMAFSDLTGLDTADLSKLTSGFGGGMGRMREVCGAFSGIVMMSGVLSPASDPSRREERTANYALVRRFAEEFRRRNGGSIICRELLGLGKGIKESPTPSVRNDEYYKKRPCCQIVREAAAIIGEYLVNNQNTV